MSMFSILYTVLSVPVLGIRYRSVQFTTRTTNVGIISSFKYFTVRFWHTGIIIFAMNSQMSSVGI